MYVTEKEARERIRRGRVSIPGGEDLGPNLIESDKDENPDKVDDNKKDVQAQVLPIHRGGRKKGDNNIPNELRILAGTLANMDTVKNVSEALGISHSQTQQFKHGIKTHELGVDTELKQNIEDALEPVRDLALKRVMQSLDLLDEKEIEKAKPREKAAIARDMSTIVKNITPERGGSTIGQVVFYAPKVREEQEYGDIVEVN